MVPQANDPAAIPNFGQLYSKTVTTDPITDQALFWETGTGLVQQLTVNFAPLVSSNGYTFIPGGLIIQWGIVSPPGTSGSVVFTTAGNINFDNNIFGVFLQLLRTDGSANESAVISTKTVAFTKTGFGYATTASGSSTILYWVAIGN